MKLRLYLTQNLQWKSWIELQLCHLQGLLTVLNSDSQCHLSAKINVGKQCLRSPTFIADSFIVIHCCSGADFETKIFLPHQSNFLFDLMAYRIVSLVLFSTLHCCLFLLLEVAGYHSQSFRRLFQGVPVLGFNLFLLHHALLYLSNQCLASYQIVPSCHLVPQRGLLL